MRLYYRAVTQDGKTIRGLIDAKDEKEAAEYLRKHQFLPIKIIADQQRGFSRYLLLFKRASSSDLVFFTRQLASILSSGLTLMQALHILQSQVEAQNPTLQEIIKSLIRDIEDGKKFSAAIEKYPKFFPQLYVSLIRTAEASGLLDKVLLRLSDNLEKQQALNRKIQGALLYPAVVLFMMVVVIVIMMIFVIPQLSGLYTEMQIDLPFTTQIVVSFSNAFVVGWPFMLGGVFAVVYGFRKWYQSSIGRRIIDMYTLKIPVFGKLMQETMMAEFTRTLGMLINAGSLVVESLEQSSDVVGNVLYKDAILLVSKRVEKGITMGDAMEASPFFPPIVVEMVKIGEQTGKLDESLARASEYYEREVEQTVKTLTTLMEPAIMVLLALGVGFLIFSVITPIYSLISNF